MFFFFKQKTAYYLRISDWSSDVCSSDLQARDVHLAREHRGDHRGVSLADEVRPIEDLAHDERKVMRYHLGLLDCVLFDDAVAVTVARYLRLFLRRLLRGAFVGFDRLEIGRAHV